MRGTTEEIERLGSGEIYSRSEILPPGCLPQHISDAKDGLIRYVNPIIARIKARNPGRELVCSTTATFNRRNRTVVTLLVERTDTEDDQPGPNEV